MGTERRDVLNKRSQEIMDNFESMKIGVDDSFKFHCKQCGKCCIHREDILLTPRDIYNMSKELKLTPDEMCKKYCEVYIGPDSRVPIVRLQPRGSIRRCPLLKDRKCSVHKVKPTVCAMYPLGRSLMVDQANAGQKKFRVEDTIFIFTGGECGDDTESHTVREWLTEFGIPISDEFFIKWQNLIMEIGEAFCKMEKRMGPDTMQMVWMAALAALYLHYDTGKEFLPQFEENAAKYLELLYNVFPKSS